MCVAPVALVPLLYNLTNMDACKRRASRFFLPFFGPRVGAKIVMHKINTLQYWWTKGGGVLMGFKLQALWVQGPGGKGSLLFNFKEQRCANKKYDKINASNIG